MPSRNGTRPVLHVYAQEHFCVRQIALLWGIERCIDDVRYWMLNGKLKINDDKNEFLIIGPSQQLGKVFQILSLCAGLVVIIPKSALKFARAHTKVGFPTEYLFEVEKALRI